MTQGTTKGVPIDTDTALTADSDALVPSQKAIKAYVDGGAYAPGSNTQVVYNDNGTYNSSSAFTFDDSVGQVFTNYFTPKGLGGVGAVSALSVGNAIGFQYNPSSWTDALGVNTTTGVVTIYTSINVNGATVWDSSNDGAASGLDADLLDGQEGSYYLARANHTGTQTLSTISDAGTAAAEDIGTSGDALGKLNTANTWSAVQHQSFAGNVIPVLTSTDNSAVQLRFKSDSTNRRFLAVNSADSVKSQLGFGNDEIRLAGNNYSTNLYAVFNGSGLAVTGDISATGSVGIGTASPAASAALDVTSTTKGFLPPRMTTAQRDAIASPATGLTVFNTDSGELNVYDGTAWRIISSRVVYKDMIAPVAAARLPPASAPTWDSFGPTATPQRQELAFAVGDYAIISPFHVNHDIKPGGNAYLHVHWTTNGTNTGLVKWEMSYMRAKGHDQANFGAPVTLSIEEAAAGTAWRHMITETGTAIVMTEPDELILVVLKRVSPSAGSNSDTVFGLQVDLHYEADRDGTPNKTPNFYT